MPRFCVEFIENLSTNFYLSGVYMKACEVVIPFLGIDPGSEDEEKSFWSSFTLPNFMVFHSFSTYVLQIALLATLLVVPFVVGIYVRRSTVLGLLRQKEEWHDKEKQILKQLWTALEEKIESKARMQEIKTELDELKADYKQEKSANERLQVKVSGLQENIAALQEERDSLEEKLRDCVKTFGALKKSISNGQGNGKGESGFHVDQCMDKIKGLQDLMQKLIKAHRQEHINFVSLLEQKPSV